MKKLYILCFALLLAYAAVAETDKGFKENIVEGAQVVAVSELERAEQVVTRYRNGREMTTTKINSGNIYVISSGNNIN